MFLYAWCVEFCSCPEPISAFLYICKLSANTTPWIPLNYVFISWIVLSYVWHCFAFKSWDVQASLEYIIELINNQARLLYPVHWLSIIPSCPHYSWSTSAYLRNRTSGINIHCHILQLNAEVMYQGADTCFNVHISYNGLSWIFIEMFVIRAGRIYLRPKCGGDGRDVWKG